MAEYIEREALMEDCKCMIDEAWNRKTTPVSWSHAYAEFLDNVERAPAADVAPVGHGQWEHYSTTMMVCSICGKHIARHRYNYCPNCGAKMDGGAENG